MTKVTSRLRIGTRRGPREERVKSEKAWTVYDWHLGRRVKMTRDRDEADDIALALNTERMAN